MHYNVYDVLYSQFSHQHVSAATALVRLKRYDKTVNKTHHKHCSAFCWFYTNILWI